MDDLRNSFYKFYTWLSISGNNVSADQLNAPRIRTAPDTPSLEDLQIENSKFTDVEILNLPYQELSQTYQSRKFFEVLFQCSDSSYSDVKKTKIGNDHQDDDEQDQQGNKTASFEPGL